jgi:hypothetical protein
MGIDLAGETGHCTLCRQGGFRNIIEPSGLDVGLASLRKKRLITAHEKRDWADVSPWDFGGVGSQ